MLSTNSEREFIDKVLAEANEVISLVVLKYDTSLDILVKLHVNQTPFETSSRIDRLSEIVMSMSQSANKLCVDIGASYEQFSLINSNLKMEKVLSLYESIIAQSDAPDVLELLQSSVWEDLEGCNLEKIIIAAEVLAEKGKQDAALFVLNKLRQYKSIASCQKNLQKLVRVCLIIGTQDAINKIPDLLDCIEDKEDIYDVLVNSSVDNSIVSQMFFAYLSANDALAGLKIAIENEWELSDCQKLLEVVVPTSEIIQLAAKKKSLEVKKEVLKKVPDELCLYAIDVFKNYKNDLKEELEELISRVNPQHINAVLLDDSRSWFRARLVNRLPIYNYMLKECLMSSVCSKDGALLAELVAVVDPEKLCACQLISCNGFNILHLALNKQFGEEVLIKLLEKIPAKKYWRHLKVLMGQTMFCTM